MGVRPLVEGEKLLSLTAVVYQRGDTAGQLLAAISLLPLVLVVGLATCILCRREVHTCFFLLGQLLTELLNKALKETLRQPRPADAPADDYGMPSSHSQFMGFFAAYYCSFALSRLGHHSRLEVVGSCLMSCAAALAVCYSRIYLSYHTVGQVVAGSGLGIACGLLWRCLAVAVGPRLFPAIEGTGWARRFHLHDASTVDNVFVSAAGAARQARARKRS